MWFLAALPATTAEGTALQMDGKSDAVILRPRKHFNNENDNDEDYPDGEDRDGENDNNEDYPDGEEREGENDNDKDYADLDYVD